MRIWNRSCAYLMLSLLPMTASAADLPRPLDPADPAAPLELIADLTWSAAEMQPAADGRTTYLQIPPFKTDASKGAVRLVLDYGTLNAAPDSSALVEVGIECPEARMPCAIPIQDTVVGFRSAYLGDLPLGSSGKVLKVAREAREYRFEDGTVVDMDLVLKESPGMAPEVMRARVFYGRYNDGPLPGQTTRSSRVTTIMAIVGGLLLLVFWWSRR